MSKILPAEGGRSLEDGANLPLSVSEVTRYVKSLIEGDPRLSWVVVRGEASNCKLHSSGHLYFTLKDETSSIRCVMFRKYARALRFSPRNGLSVIAVGYVGVYERDGLYQLYAYKLEEDGLGLLHAALERLKARLQAEGLFAPERKRKLPMFPRKIGVVTSATGAAVRDVLAVTYERFPRAHLVLAPVLVQGDRAPDEIARALRFLSEVDGVDVIIVARGGGSTEELFAFNDERVARAIYACPVPVVSGVGHETDLTIADLVADARAPTPTAAAQAAVPDEGELAAKIESLTLRAYSSCRGRLEAARGRYLAVSGRPVLTQSDALLRQKVQRTDDAVEKLHEALRLHLERKSNAVKLMSARLGALNPSAVLGRGYAICLKLPPRSHVCRTADVSVGDGVAVVLQDGEIDCLVRGKEALSGGNSRSEGR